MKTTALLFSQTLLAGALLLACGGNVSVDNAGGGGGGGGDTKPTTGQGGSGGPGTTGSGTTGSTTTPTPTSPPDGPGAAVAMRKLRIGDSDPNGQPSSTAWKQYGFDIDGKVSTKESVDLCKPAAGAKPSTVYPDGDNGIDNSWGKNVLPLFYSLSTDMGTLTNANIEKGRFSVLILMEGIGPGATGTFVAGAATAGFTSEQGPLWNGQDLWPLRSDSLQGGNNLLPKCGFTTSTVTVGGAGQRIWQSNATCDIELIFVVIGSEMRVPIRGARFTGVLSDDNTKMTSGMIGGVIDTEQFIMELAKVAGNFDPSLCPPSATFESIAQQIRQASDILTDGTQNPNVTCDGISIGLGFDAEQAEWGLPYDPEAPPDPCF